MKPIQDRYGRHRRRDLGPTQRSRLSPGCAGGLVFGLSLDRSRIDDEGLLVGTCSTSIAFTIACTGGSLVATVSKSRSRRSIDFELLALKSDLVVVPASQPRRAQSWNFVVVVRIYAREGGPASRRLRARARQDYALVGPTGAARPPRFLMARFYDPLAGRCCFGGRDIRSYSRGSRPACRLICKEPFCSAAPSETTSSTAIRSAATIRAQPSGAALDEARAVGCSSRASRVGSIRR